jgi:1-acyl-sn-glycerol-3-phosphate acyltransferase
LTKNMLATSPDILFEAPLHLSRGMLGAMRTSVSLHHRERIPDSKCMIIVSNHRSPLDAPLLMSAINRPIRFACHYYMSKIPVLREMVATMGAFPLDAPNHRQKSFFQKAVHLLQSGQVVGVFPEGAKPMVQFVPPDQPSSFQRGFAHLALRAPIDDLAILPVAIASVKEQVHTLAPLKMFNLIDPSEPLFDSNGWHYAIMYQRARLLFGHPIHIHESLRQQYRGRNGGPLAKELTYLCRSQIIRLLQQGCS